MARSRGVPSVELRALNGTIDLIAEFKRAFGSPPSLKAWIAGQPVSVAMIGTSFRLRGNGPADREGLLAFVEWAEALGTPWLRVFDGCKTSDAAEIGDAVATLWLVDRRARKEGLHGRAVTETHDATAEPAALRAFLAAAPEAKILWDAHHTWRRGGEAPRETWAYLKRHVVHVHFKDSATTPGIGEGYGYVPPGDGEFPLNDLAAVLGSGWLCRRALPGMGADVAPGRWRRSRRLSTASSASRGGAPPAPMRPPPIDPDRYGTNGIGQKFMIAAVGPLDPRAPEETLLDLVQRQTLRYFWDFAHPVSGLARERSNRQPEIVTTGGSGFGIMAILVGIERGWLPRRAALDRLLAMLGFLAKADRFHGAFPHWLDGATGRAIRFSPKDDGGDLVETAFLIAGLLAARQYFSAGGSEAELRDRIDALWRAVEWDWYTRGADVLYWHWSPTHEWAMNHAIRGWNECLIAYLLAASSPTHPIDPEIYHRGWASGPDFANGQRVFRHAAAARSGLWRPALLRPLLVSRASIRAA